MGTVVSRAQHMEKNWELFEPHALSGVHEFGPHWQAPEASVYGSVHES